MGMAAAFQESGLADAFEGLGFQECSWSWFQVWSKLRGKTRARPIWRIEGKEATSSAQVPHSQVISVFPWTQLCKMSLSATFKIFRIQCFPLLIKILATIHTNHRNMLKNCTTLCPNCTKCCSISLTKMTKVYSIFKEGKKKLQRIQYQQPECGHWEATKWTLPSSGTSVFVIINIIIVIFIMIISDFSM